MQYQPSSHPRKLLQNQVLITSPAIQTVVSLAINISSMPPSSPAASQESLDSATPSLDPNNFSPSVAAILVALLSAFFFMGFFSIYVRRCVDDPDRRRAAARGPSSVEEAPQCSPNQQGLDLDFLNSLPLITYSSVKKKAGSPVECAVCLTDFEEHEPLRQLPKCKHVFHQDCIDIWLLSHLTCPVCRRNLGEVESRSASVRWGAGSANIFQRLLESTRAGSRSPLPSWTTATEDGYDVEMNRTASADERNQDLDVVRNSDSFMVPSTIVCGDFCLPNELRQEGHGTRSESNMLRRERRQPSIMRYLKRCNSTGHSVVKPGALVETLPSVEQTRLTSRSSALTSSATVGCFRIQEGLRRSRSTTALPNNVVLH